MTIKLPEPRGYFSEWPGYGKGEEKWLCMTCLPYKSGEDSEPFYTEAQLKQAIRDALEEAAKTILNRAENFREEGCFLFEDVARDDAGEIRKLKEQLK